MGWRKLLAYITGSVEKELLLRNEYLVAENLFSAASSKTVYGRVTASARRWPRLGNG